MHCFTIWSKIEPSLVAISLDMRAILVKDTSCIGKCIRNTFEEKHKWHYSGISSELCPAFGDFVMEIPGRNFPFYYRSTHSTLPYSGWSGGMSYVDMDIMSALLYNQIVSFPCWSKTSSCTKHLPTLGQLGFDNEKSPFWLVRDPVHFFNSLYHVILRDV